MKPKRIGWYKIRPTYKWGYGKWQYHHGTHEEILDWIQICDIGDPEGLRLTEIHAIKSPPANALQEIIEELNRLIYSNQKETKEANARIAELTTLLHKRS